MVLGAPKIPSLNLDVPPVKDLRIFGYISNDRPSRLG